VINVVDCDEPSVGDDCGVVIGGSNRSYVIIGVCVISSARFLSDSYCIFLGDCNGGGVRGVSVPSVGPRDNESKRENAKAGEYKLV
jgi:hypothetical protein